MCTWLPRRELPLGRPLAGAHPPVASHRSETGAKCCWGRPRKCGRDGSSRPSLGGNEQWLDHRRGEERGTAVIGCGFRVPRATSNTWGLLGKTFSPGSDVHVNPLRGKTPSNSNRSRATPGTGAWSTTSSKPPPASIHTITSTSQDERASMEACSPKLSTKKSSSTNSLPNPA